MGATFIGYTDELFPFLIGKVLTSANIPEYVVYLPHKFPFLIGKVLTQKVEVIPLNQEEARKMFPVAEDKPEE